MKIFALLLVVVLATATSASFSPSSFEVRSQLNQMMKERWSAVEADAIKESQTDVSVRMSACDAADPLNDNPCDCATRSGSDCVWIIGLVIVGDTSTTSGTPGLTSGASGGSNIQASVEGKCVEGTHLSGPSSSLELNLFETCWWPSEEQACDEICTWRMAIEIPGFPVYFRAELKIDNTFRVRDQSDAQNMFSKISFVAFMMYASPDASALGIPTDANFPGFPIFTGTAMMLAAAGEGGIGGGSQSAGGSAGGSSASSSSSSDEGFPGVRGAASFLMMDSFYTYDLATYPDGYDGSNPATVTATPLAVSGFTGTPLIKPTDANGIKYNTWTMTAAVGTGQVQYKCVFSEFPFVYNTKTLTPYDAKCDLIASGLNIPAGHGFGVRMLVAAAAGEYNAATNTATHSITIGASALEFAPTASTPASGSVTVHLSGVSTCNSDVEDETFFSQDDFTTTLDENMGPGFDVLCTYASFASEEAAWTWDPETKVDRTKAEASIAAKTSSAVSSVASPVALMVAAILATLIAFLA